MMNSLGIQQAAEVGRGKISLSLSASSHMKEDKMSRDEPSKFTSETFGRQYLADEDSVNDS